MAKAFDAEKKAALLALLQSGKTIKDACTQLGMSRNTVYSHTRKDAEFAEKFNTIMHGEKDAGMDEHDLVKVLERKARQGSVQATKLLMEYRVGLWPRKSKPKPEEPVPTLIDELAARRA